MSEDVILILIWFGFIFGGVHAWWARHRKTACCLWALAVLLPVSALAPSFVKARPTAQKNACIANLKQIDSAVQQWALDHEKQATNSYTFADPTLLSLMRGSALPACPGGGHYSPGPTVAGSPKCSLAAKGHTL